MKTKYDGRVTRTSGRKTQPEFDNLLAKLDVSSLCFLNGKYMHDIRDFPNHFNLNHPDYQQFYQEILQRKRMISEELNHRMMDINASISYQDRKEFFNPNTGIVIDKNYNVLYSVAYTEDEDSIIYNHMDNPISYSSEVAEDDETEYEYYEPIDNKKAYAVWNYYEELDEVDKK